MIELYWGFFTCRIRGRSFYGRRDNLKDVSNKVVKHEKTCSDNQHTFIQFNFDSFDFLTSEDVDILYIIQMVMHINVMTPKSINIVFMIICFVMTHVYVCLCVESSDTNSTCSLINSVISLFYFW